MKRDGLTREEAKAILWQSMQHVQYALIEGENPQSIEDIWQLHTGLESDYLHAIL